MEPSNRPFRKEHDLPNLHDYVPAVNLEGCRRGGLSSSFTPIENSKTWSLDA